MSISYSNINLYGCWGNGNLGDELLYISAIKALVKSNIIEGEVRFRIVTRKSEGRNNITSLFFRDLKITFGSPIENSLNVLVGGTIFSNKYKILTKLKIFINEFILNKLDCYPVDLVLSLGVDFHPKKIKSLSKCQDPF